MGTRHITYMTLGAVLHHLRLTWTQCDRSRRSQSMHASSMELCSWVSYEQSWVWGQTKAKMRSSTGAGRAASLAAEARLGEYGRC